MRNDRPAGQVGGRGLDVDRPADRGKRPGLVRVGHLLGPDREHDVTHPARDGLPGEVESGGRRGAGVLHVEHRDAAESERPQEELAGQHLLPGHGPGDRVAEIAGLHVIRGQAGVLQRGRDRLAGEVLQAAAGLLGEPRHTDSGHLHVSHRHRS
jgi:hypothetical protein